MPLDLSDCLAAAVHAAQAAGRLLLERWSGLALRYKGQADPVTDVDEAAQALIRDVLLHVSPDFGFLGEESAEHTLPGTKDQPLWVVDPIDGTANYVHGFPFYAVSIALAVGPDIKLGVIYDPVRDEMFQATCEGPALLNGRRLQATSTATLVEALLVMGYSLRPEEQTRLLQLWQRLALRSHGLRRTGSAALNLAYVAAGRFDAFYACGVQSWDVAAGILLVQRSGGQVSDSMGQRYHLHQHRELLASNGPLHAALLTELHADA